MRRLLSCLPLVIKGSSISSFLMPLYVYLEPQALIVLSITFTGYHLSQDPLSCRF